MVLLMYVPMSQKQLRAYANRLSVVCEVASSAFALFDIERYLAIQYITNTISQICSSIEQVR